MRSIKGILRSIGKRIPGRKTLDAWLCRRYTGMPQREVHPRGHFYSPLPDVDDIRSRSEEIFRDDVGVGPAIDLRRKEQRAFLEECAPFYDEFPWRDGGSEGRRFYLGQNMFPHADALMLYLMMRRFEPARIIEVGSGFSSALMLDTNDIFFGGRIRCTFIEPYPDRLNSLLREGDDRNAAVIVDAVQNVPLAAFRELGENDILFIDSSHVCKVGSDVNHLVFNVLPVLEPGVVIHFHDIGWPFEYPLQWIIDGRAWNEAYLLRAFLQYNRSFEILVFNSYAYRTFRPFFEERMPLYLEKPGGSLWLRKTGE